MVCPLLLCPIALVPCPVLLCRAREIGLARGSPFLDVVESLGPKKARDQEPVAVDVLCTEAGEPDVPPGFFQLPKFTELREHGVLQFPQKDLAVLLPPNRPGLALPFGQVPAEQGVARSQFGYPEGPRGQVLLRTGNLPYLVNWKLLGKADLRSDYHRRQLLKKF